MIKQLGEPRVARPESRHLELFADLIKSATIVCVRACMRARARACVCACVLRGPAAYAFRNHVPRIGATRRARKFRATAVNRSPALVLPQRDDSFARSCTRAFSNVSLEADARMLINLEGWAASGRENDTDNDDYCIIDNDALLPITILYHDTHTCARARRIDDINTMLFINRGRGEARGALRIPARRGGE